MEIEHYNSIPTNSLIVFPDEKASHIESCRPSYGSVELMCSPKICSLVISLQELAKANRMVIDSGVPNCLGIRYPVHSNIDILKLRSYLEGYFDEEVCDFLQFGWPIGYTRNIPPVATSVNHKGANEHSDQVDKYLEKELSYQSVIGPIDLKNNPFTVPIVTSPLQSVAKRDSSERRIVVDLSFPPGSSINDGIPREFYLGKPMSISYPSTDDLVSQVVKKGQGCYLSKRDLKRAYRQLPVDPGDAHMLGYQWKGRVYVDRVLPMGLRSAAMACQRVTNAISYIFQERGFTAINYLDDFGIAETPDQAMNAFQALGNLLQDLGFKEALEKAVPPTTRMVFLGILFDTTLMQLQVSVDRLSEIKLLVKIWLEKVSSTRRDMERLVGKLNFVARCVRPGRIFISRMLDRIRNIPGRDSLVLVGDSFRKDLQWWNRFLDQYNGISIISEQLWSCPDCVVATDACMIGAGGINHDQGEYFHHRFSQEIISMAGHISALEMLAIMVATKLWGKHWKGKRIRINCDNLSAAQVLNIGRSRDHFMVECVREILFLAATFQFEIRASHIAGVENRIPDHLSRWYSSGTSRRAFKRETSNRVLSKRYISDDLLKFCNTW